MCQCANQVTLYLQQYVFLLHDISTLTHISGFLPTEFLFIHHTSDEMNQSTIIGLYLGTKAFMIHQPIK